ncbi:MAG: hypothetical protein ABW088_02375 [Sedimenticola sp.]
MEHQYNINNTTAVVIGLCVHGLAVSRALAKGGVEVHAIESDTKLPGIHTSSSIVHIVNSIAGKDLICNLINLHPYLKSGSWKPVLFPINDEMVGSIADSWNELEDLYCLSWSCNIDLVKSLLNKENLATFCQESGLNYPSSSLVNDVHSLELIPESPNRQYIVKPNKPLSSFKVKKVNNKDEISKLITKHKGSLPFICQPWIEGDDSSIYFCAIYYDKGVPLCSFIGQKILSHPPALGQTTAALPSNNKDILNYTLRFFSEFDITGPVSLEIKVDIKGEYWVIEPTVGRTDYWIDCCIQNGVNIPYIEYLNQVGKKITDSSEKGDRVWLDSSKDPLIIFKIIKHIGLFSIFKSPPRFAYCDLRDYRPVYYSLIDLLKRKSKKFFTWQSDTA